MRKERALPKTHVKPLRTTQIGRWGEAKREQLEMCDAHGWCRCVGSRDPPARRVPDTDTGPPHAHHDDDTRHAERHGLHRPEHAGRPPAGD